MFSVGTQRTLARVSSASAIQTLACAAATTSGRASESRKAVARLIGNRRSVGNIGVGLNRRPVARASALTGAGPAPPGRVNGARGPGRPGKPGKAGGRSLVPPALPGPPRGEALGGDKEGGPPIWGPPTGLA